jgi:hypothetical protein
MDQSTFTWLAYSEREQQSAQNLASSLSERETRDELGIGSIRDAIADRLFPGTSTLQSRARYFLFIPWVFQNLERHPKGRARERSDQAERNLIAALRLSDDTRGLVGSRTALVERLPSSIYWSGLRVLGIRRVARPLSAYFRWLDDPRRVSRVARDDDGVPIEGVVRTWWDRLPASPEDFPGSAAFTLSQAESQYLTGRVVAATPYPTMLGFLFDAGHANAEAPFPWQHPQSSSMPAGVCDDLEIAEHFSLIHYGAALLYNQLIAEARSDEERSDEYRDQVRAWQTENTSAIQGFDLGRVWQLASRSSASARRFVEDWRKVVIKADGQPLADDRAARELLTSREVRVKGKERSRIANPFRVEWNGASGSARLDYRWGAAVHRIALDVAEGRAHA